MAKALEMLREGDTIVVWKLDQLGRSVKDLVDLVGQLHQKGIHFKSLTDAIDTGKPLGRFCFQVAEHSADLAISNSLAMKANRRSSPHLGA